MEQRQAGVRSLTAEEGIEVVDIPMERRSTLDHVLEESFEGWYLRHSRRILQEVETVRAGMLSGEPIGLIMLKTLEPGVGYVYYVAVAKSHRARGVASLLLKDALDLFKSRGDSEVFASVEKDNLPSEKLFVAEGFVKTNLMEVSQLHGTLRAFNMYRMMMVVPGEVLMHRKIG
jgi:ribosomal protein S18 acetylase RimI-like enzyme